MPDVGYYTLPVILSFEGVDKQVNSKLGKAFDGIGKKAGRDVGKNLGAGLKETEADVKRAADAYGKLRDKASDALGKVRKEEAALQDLRGKGITSGTRFVAAEERLAKARRDSNRATRDAGDAHTVMLSSQKRLASGTDDLGGKFGKLGAFAGTAGTALAGAGAIAGGAALAGIAALGAGVLLAGNRLYELGQQFDDLSDNLQVKTGLSGAALNELKDSVERLGTTNVPSSFAEIGDVAAEVVRSLHLTGPEFDAVTSRLANLSRMGVDVDIRSLGKAFRGFGIDAKDQAPALNSLYEASTKSGLSIDDLTAAVVKGGPALRQLGLDFGESAALIGTFEEAGLDGEKGMTALNKAFAYFSKEGIPAEQGLRDIIGQIQTLGDTPQAGELANKVFGAKGGAAFLEAIQTGALDLQSLSNSLQSTGLDINQVSDDTADWSEKWQDLKNEAAVALEPFATGLFEGVNTELGKVADKLVENKGEIVDFFESLGSIVITGAENFAHGIGGMLQALGDLVGGIGNVKGALDEGMAQFADLRGDEAGAEAFRKSSQEAYGWGESLRAAGDKLAGLNLDPLRDGLHNIANEANTSATEVTGFGNALGQLPASKTVTLDADTEVATAKLTAFGQELTRLAGLAAFPIGTPPPPGAPLRIGPAGGRASGGPISGAGGPTSDIIPIWASNGEHMLSAKDVAAMGGQGGVYAFRNALHRAGGGSIDDQLLRYVPSGTYSQSGSADLVQGLGDCSSAVEDLVNLLDGRSTAGRSMSTGNAAEWLAANGFVAGMGGPGDMRVGFNSGHMQATLPDGTPFNWGSSAAAAAGGRNGGLGAADPSLTSHYYRPVTSSLSSTTGAYGAADPQKIADAEEKLRREQADVAQQEQELRELKADATASQRMAAEEQLRRAKADEAKAQQELAEAKRGEPLSASDLKSSGSEKSGAGDLSPIGQIFGSFLKETLGFDGSVFPDIANLMPVQMAGNLLSAFSGPLQGAMAGQLGIQQPGWQPGMPVQTSNGGFGMPNVAAPAMPAPGVHGGTGVPPGPPQGVTIDASQTFNGTVGMDPVQIQKQQRDAAWRGLMRIP